MKILLWGIVSISAIAWLIAVNSSVVRLIHGDFRDAWLAACVALIFAFTIAGALWAKQRLVTPSSASI